MSEAQASGWCCMHSTLLQILLIFSSHKGHRCNLPLYMHILCIHYGITPDILLNLIQALHDSTGARVRCSKNLSSRFWKTSGFRQGCVLAPALFCVAIDWILAHMANKPGISVGNSQLTDLVYADDTALLVQSSTAAATCLSSFSEAASTLGLRISWPKTKLQNVGADTQHPLILL